VKMVRLQLHGASCPREEDPRTSRKAYHVPVRERENCCSREALRGKRLEGKKVSEGGSNLGLSEAQSRGKGERPPRDELLGQATCERLLAKE